MTELALDWAERNVKSNPHISELIEIRRVDVAEPASSSGTVESSGGSRMEDTSQGLCDVVELVSLEMKEFCDFGVTCKGETDKNQRRYDEAKHSNVDKGYQGPPILLGVVKDGEKFDFCMCNPPFFESMEEAGLNPKTCCGGTPEEMVCQGGERAFISRIIEDSATLKQSFRYRLLSGLVYSFNWSYGCNWIFPLLLLLGGIPQWLGGSQALNFSCQNFGKWELRL